MLTYPVEVGPDADFLGLSLFGTLYDLYNKRYTPICTDT